MFQVVGNLVYAIHYQKWLSLMGRFVSGLGDGYLAATLGEVTYLYEDENRVGMLFESFYCTESVHFTLQLAYF